MNARPVRAACKLRVSRQIHTLTRRGGYPPIPPLSRRGGSRPTHPHQLALHFALRALARGKIAQVNVQIWLRQPSLRSVIWGENFLRLRRTRGARSKIVLPASRTLIAFAKNVPVQSLRGFATCVGVTNPTLPTFQPMPAALFLDSEQDLRSARIFILK